MAGEAVLMIETHLPIPMTVSDGTGIEKGSLLVLSDPYTVAGCTTGTTNQVVGGIAAEEKIANDGKTKMAVYRGGVFKMTGSGNITAGNAVVLTGVATTGTATNKISAAAVNDENVLGIAFETSGDSETLLVELRPTVMNLA